MDDVRQKILKVAVAAAKEAGGHALRSMGSFGEVRHKGDVINSLVTDVDNKCESLIIYRIKKEFPGHSILAEESGEDLSEDEHLWIVDPLDGTTNYAHGFPVFCVSIGIMVSGKVVVGVVYDPTRDELFTAEERKGSFLNGENIHVSKTGKVRDSLITTGFGATVENRMANLDHLKKMLENAQAVRRPGSAAMDLCYVACGRTEGFWELGLNPWDTAAGQLIVKEAGGSVTVFNGEPYDVYKRELLATNGLIHQEMIALLQKA